jgi:hypothetical protein
MTPILGISLERLMMYLTCLKNIREVIPFPAQREAQIFRIDKAINQSEAVFSHARSIDPYSRCPSNPGSLTVTPIPGACA